jgi:hypothetical protein
VLYLLARDRFVARRYLRLGDRLAFSNGMIALALAAGVLFVVFAGRTQSLIPLYAVGVFLAFTLSQAGMVVHWWRRRTSRWRTSILCNGFGCAARRRARRRRGTKFTEGAWVALALVLGFVGRACSCAATSTSSTMRWRSAPDRPRAMQRRGDAAADLQPRDRPGPDAEPRDAAGAGVRVVVVRVRARAPRRSDRGGGRALPPVLGRGATMSRSR